MKTKVILKLSLKVFVLICFGQSFAQDTVENILTRIKPKKIVEIHYKETRFIGMLSSEWNGNGYLYSSQQDVFLKHQKEPEEEIMAVEGNQLYYVNPENKKHHQMQIDENENMTSSLSALKAMMIGDLSYLRKIYDIKLISSDLGGWRLHLTSKKSESNNVVQINLDGSSDQEISQIEVLLSDGDRTVYVFDSLRIDLESTKNRITELLGQLKAE